MAQHATAKEVEDVQESWLYKVHPGTTIRTIYVCIATRCLCVCPTSACSLKQLGHQRTHFTTGGSQSRCSRPDGGTRMLELYAGYAQLVLGCSMHQVLLRSLTLQVCSVLLMCHAELSATVQAEPSAGGQLSCVQCCIA